MRFTKLFALLLLAAVSISIIQACGGGGKPATSPQANTQPTVATTSASPTFNTPVPIPTSVPFTLKGTILDTALPFAPVELDNVRYGGTYRYANSNSLGILDPKFNSQSILNVGRWFYEKTVDWRPNENDILAHFEPVLVESWKASSDLKTYTFTLRKGVKWHNIAPVNGRELTADDIVFSLNRYREKDSIFYANYAQVSSIEATDSQTVVIKLNDPSAWAINDLFPTAEYIVPKELVVEEGGTIKQKVIGTGPYVVKEYAFRRGATFVRNPNYWGKDAKGNIMPYTDEITETFIADTATTSAAFRTGQLDTGIGGTDNILKFGHTIPGLRIFFGGLPSGQGVTFNTTHAPWNDVRVRRALNLATDKEKYVSFQQIPGTAWAVSGPLTWALVSDEPFTEEKLGPHWKYNPAEAKKLLIEAGFPDGKMKVATPVVAGSANYQLQLQTLQQIWKQAGIEVELQTMDIVSYSPYYYKRAHTDLTFTFQNTGDYSLNWFAQNKFATDAQQNSAYISDPEVQQVVKEVKVTTDPTKLRAQAKFLWDYDTNGSWNIWLATARGYTVVSAHIRNYAIRSGNTYTGARFLPWLSDAPRTTP